MHNVRIGQKKANCYKIGKKFIFPYDSKINTSVKKMKSDCKNKKIHKFINQERKTNATIKTKYFSVELYMVFGVD